MAKINENSVMVMLPVEKLSQHPDNPRKDLGDLTELSESIKTSGILQNLTVVSWASAHPNASSSEKEMHSDDFTVIIGHRRLAAAKLAGIDKVVCVIADMDYKKQILTMLEENMQRSDLTLYEQAESIQLMFDLGSNTTEIVEKTGFSKSTIRRRVKLLELDKNKFKESTERGATLEDYVKLEAIEDVKEKNRLLEHIGMPNFNYELQRAKDSQERKSLQRLFREKVSGQLEEVKEIDYEKYAYISSISLSKEAIENYIIPEKMKGGVFNLSYGYANFYQKKAAAASYSDKEKAESQKAEVERKRVIKNLQEINKTVEALNIEFICNFVSKKSDIGRIARCFVECGAFYEYDEAEIAELLKFDLEGETDEEEEEKWCEFYEYTEKRPERIFLSIIFIQWVKDVYTYDYYGKYTECPNLKKWYDLLESLGYQMSQDEKAFVDGTHEAYYKEKSE